MHEPELDPRVTDWLRDGPPGASPWVLAAVVNHARRRPRGRTLRARWRDAMKSVTVQGRWVSARLLTVLLAVAVLSIALTGLLYVRSQDAALAPVVTQTPSPSASVPVSSSELAALAGAWSGSPESEKSDRVTITFAACEDGGVCGIGTWMHGQRCDFTLAYNAPDEDAFVFTVESAKQMQCAWGGPESGTTFRVEPAGDGTLDLRHSSGMPPVTLRRSMSSPVPSAR